MRTWGEKQVLTNADRRQMRAIVRNVAGDFGLAKAALVAPTRGSPRAAMARQIAMYLAHVIGSLNYQRIAHHFQRDRSTVAHACRSIEELRDNAVFDARLTSLEAALSAQARAAA